MKSVLITKEISKVRVFSTVQKKKEEGKEDRKEYRRENKGR